MPEPIILDDANALSVANSNFTSLTSDANFALPNVNFSSPQFQLPTRAGNVLYNDISKLTVNDLTTRTIDGSGVFDQLMVANKVHIAEEFDKGRLTAEQYAKAYIEITSAVMNMSLQFVLQKEQNFWSNALLQSQARQAEIQVVTSATQLEITKAELVMKQYDTKTSEANYALTKMRLATENAQFSNITAQIKNTLFQVEELMPLQKIALDNENTAKEININEILPNEVLLVAKNLEISEQNRLKLVTDTSLADYQLSDILPEQKRQLVYTTDNVMVADYNKANFEFTDIMPKQRDLLTVDIDTKTFQKDEVLPVQKTLLTEQVEVQHAQTSDFKLDGVTPVTGSVGKQRELYTQQITSYKRDSEYKTAKMFLDAWITQKTLDDGLNAPAQLTNLNIDSVIATVRNNNNL